MGLASAVRSIPYRHVDNSGLTGPNSPSAELVWRGRPLMFWAQAKRAATASFYSADGIPVILSSDDHPPLMTRASTVFSVGSLFHIACGYG